MDMVLIRLAPGPDMRNRPLTPEIAVDILWSAAIPDDRLEHIRARHGPGPETVDLALFHTTDGPDSTAATTALCLCYRAIETAPALAGWTAVALTSGPRPDTTSAPVTTT
jgi:hypothetical protein